MKTSMQELFEWLENSSDIKNDILNWDIVKDNALEKEKEQILNSYVEGRLCSYNDNPSIKAEQYYNETYQNKVPPCIGHAFENE